eukprot:Gb_38376 [translate_table: standard]
MVLGRNMTVIGTSSVQETSSKSLEEGNLHKQQKNAELPLNMPVERRHGGFILGFQPGMSARELEAYRISRPSGSKDRHSMVATSKGPRDRRLRLSTETAVILYELQHRLGFDQPSKALEWLIQKSQYAILNLPQVSSSGFRLFHCLQSRSRDQLRPSESNAYCSKINHDYLKNLDEKIGGVVSSCNDLSCKSSVAQQPSPDKSKQKSREKSGLSIHKSLCLKLQRNSLYLGTGALDLKRGRKLVNAFIQRREGRAKARERARERTKEKLRSNQSTKSSSQKQSSHVDRQLSDHLPSHKSSHFPQNTNSGSSLVDSVNESTAMNEFTLKLSSDKAFLNRPQFLSDNRPQDSILNTSNSNSTLSYLHTEMQSSHRESIRYCTPQVDQFSCIQSKSLSGSLNSTLFPLSSLNPDSPLLQVVPLTSDQSLDYAHIQSCTPMPITSLSQVSSSNEIVQELQLREDNPNLSASMESLSSTANILLSSTLNPISGLLQTSSDSFNFPLSPSHFHYLSFENENFWYESNTSNMPAA